MALKAENIEPKQDQKPEITFHDFYLRFLCTPLLGILIPYLAGTLQYSSLTGYAKPAAYLYFILVAFLLWEANLQILRSNLRKNYSSVPGYLLRISKYIILTIFLGAILLYGWFAIPGSGPVNHLSVWLCQVMIAISIVIIASYYESILLIYRNNEAQLQNEKISSAMLQTELESLKNKIDPHFMFNSLNTLSYLIETNPNSAKIYCNGISDVYRYILHNKNTKYVFLEEELQFLQNYQNLLQVRFGDAVKLQIPPELMNDKRWLILPVSLQILVENALKHNSFDAKNPLKIEFSIVNGNLLIKNEKRPLFNKPESHGFGLRILNDRLRLLMNKSLQIEDFEDTFSVFMPLPELTT